MRFPVAIVVGAAVLGGAASLANAGPTCPSPWVAPGSGRAVPANIPGITVIAHSQHVRKMVLRERAGSDVIALPGEASGASFVAIAPPGLRPNTEYEVTFEEECAPAAGPFDVGPIIDPCAPRAATTDGGAASDGGADGGADESDPRWPVSFGPPYLIRTAPPSPLPTKLLADAPVGIRAEGADVILFPIIAAEHEPFRPLTNVSIVVTALGSSQMTLTRSGLGGPLPTVSLACGARASCRDAVAPGLVIITVSAHFPGYSSPISGTEDEVATSCARVVCGAAPSLERADCPAAPPGVADAGAPRERPFQGVDPTDDSRCSASPPGRTRGAGIAVGGAFFALALARLRRARAARESRPRRLR